MQGFHAKRADNSVQMAERSKKKKTRTEKVGRWYCEEVYCVLCMVFFLVKH